MKDCDAVRFTSAPYTTAPGTETYKSVKASKANPLRLSSLSNSPFSCTRLTHRASGEGRTGYHDLALGFLVYPMGQEHIDVPHHPATSYLIRRQHWARGSWKMGGPFEQDECQFCPSAVLFPISSLSRLKIGLTVFIQVPFA